MYWLSGVEGKVVVSTSAPKELCPSRAYLTCVVVSSVEIRLRRRDKGGAVVCILNVFLYPRPMCLRFKLPLCLQEGGKV